MDANKGAIEVQKRGQFTVFRPMDRMAGGDADELLEQLNKAMDEGEPFLAVDFSRVDYFSSRTIGVLAQAHKSAAERGGKLVLGGVNDTMTKMITYVKLDRLFTILHSQGELELLLKKAESKVADGSGESEKASGDDSGEKSDDESDES